MRKKILYLIPHLQNVGPVAQLYSLISHLDYNYFEPTIVTIFPERENSMLEQFKTFGIKIVCGNAKKWQTLTQKKMIKDAIWYIKPDIVHSCSTITDSICASLDITQPLIITLHNSIYEDIIILYGKYLGRYLCNREKKAILSATCVIPCSETLGKQYKEIVPRDYTPISNGIETNKWKNETCLSTEELREKLGLPKDKFIIISTGALIERKNPCAVINAFKRAAVKDTLLLMLGSGDLADRCKQIANNDVFFTGRVNNVKEYLYASDLLISASNAEGLPYAILEAECTDIRMILSDIPQHREALGENSEKVSFFPVAREDKIAELLKKEVEKGRYRESYNTDRITAKAMSDKYMNVYKRLSAT